MAEVSLVNLPLDERYSTLLIISQHWFRSKNLQNIFTISYRTANSHSLFLQWFVNLFGALTVLFLFYHYWLGAIRQQAITWPNVDPDLCRQLASLGLNELM